MSDHILHDPCSSSVQKELKETLWKLYRGTMETFYFQPDTQFQPHVDTGKKKAHPKRVTDTSKENNVSMQHRIFISFVLPCPNKIFYEYEHDDAEDLLSSEDIMYHSENERESSEKPMEEDVIEVEKEAIKKDAVNKDKDLAISAMIDEAIKTLIKDENQKDVVAGTVNNAEGTVNAVVAIPEQEQITKGGIVCTTKPSESAVVSDGRKNEATGSRKDETVGVIANDKPIKGNGGSKVTSRCRKTSPLGLKPSSSSPGTPTDQENFEVVQISIPPLVAAAAKSMSIIKSEAVKRDVPDGYTHEQWILQEGLHKARKLGLHRNADKSFFPFTCPLCSKKYRNPNGIKYHAKYAHGPKCIFPCDMCEKTYATRHGLAAHKRAHEAAKIEKELELEREKIRNQKIRPAIKPMPIVAQPEPDPWILKIESSGQQQQQRSDNNNNNTNDSAQPSTVFMTSIKQEVMDVDIDD